MNYFAHFYFDRNEDPYHNLGLVLPDFSRITEGRRKLHLEMEMTDPLFAALKAGCTKHYVADAWFHESEIFTRTCAFIEGLLHQEPQLFAGQRPWFMAHILAELTIDRILIRKYPGELSLFYTHLETIDLPKVFDFLSLTGKSNFTRLEKFYHGFVAARYLFYYTQDDKLVYSLDRVIGRTGQPPLTSAAMRYLEQQLAHLEAFIGKIKKPAQMNGL